MLDKVIKERYKKFKTLTPKVQIIFDEETIKNKGGLQNIWQLILERTVLTVNLHKLDSTLLAQVNVTIATKLLKKHFKQQIISKTIRQIRSGKMTSPFKPLVPEKETHRSNFLYSAFYSLALISAGWMGKAFWDAGGVHYSIKTGSYLVNQLIAELKV